METGSFMWRSVEACISKAVIYPNGERSSCFQYTIYSYIPSSIRFLLTSRPSNLQYEFGQPLDTAWLWTSDTQIPHTLPLWVWSGAKMWSVAQIEPQAQGFQSSLELDWKQIIIFCIQDKNCCFLKSKHYFYKAISLLFFFLFVCFLLSLIS